MTSFLFVIRRIYRNQLKCNYLRKKFFFNFLLHIWNLPQTLNILIKDYIQRLCNSDIRDCKKRGYLNV